MAIFMVMVMVMVIIVSTNCYHDNGVSSASLSVYMSCRASLTYPQ